MAAGNEVEPTGWRTFLRDFAGALLGLIGGFVGVVALLLGSGAIIHLFRPNADVLRNATFAGMICPGIAAVLAGCVAGMMGFYRTAGLIVGGGLGLIVVTFLDAFSRFHGL